MGRTLQVFTCNVHILPVLKNSLWPYFSSKHFPMWWPVLLLSCRFFVSVSTKVGDTNHELQPGSSKWKMPALSIEMLAAAVRPLLDTMMNSNGFCWESPGLGNPRWEGEGERSAKPKSGCSVQHCEHSNSQPAVLYGAWGRPRVMQALLITSYI